MPGQQRAGQRGVGVLGLGPGEEPPAAQEVEGEERDQQDGAAEADGLRRGGQVPEPPAGQGDAEEERRRQVPGGGEPRPGGGDDGGGEDRGPEPEHERVVEPVLPPLPLRRTGAVGPGIVGPGIVGPAPPAPGRPDGPHDDATGGGDHGPAEEDGAAEVRHPVDDAGADLPAPRQPGQRADAE